MTTIRVVGWPQAIGGEIGATLLDCLQRAAVPISTSCGGRSACGLCRITVLQGNQYLSPLLPSEIGHLGSVAKIVGTRLACQAKLVSDGEVEIEVPESTDVRARKRDQARQRARERTRPTSSRSKAPACSPAPGAEQVEWRPRKLTTTGELEGSTEQQEGARALGAAGGRNRRGRPGR